MTSTKALPRSRTCCASNGYLEATVDPETNFDRARNIADVTFHVTAGPQATIADVIIEGDTAPFTRAQLIERMKRGPGQDVQPAAKRAKTRTASRTSSSAAITARADVDFLGHTYDRSHAQRAAALSRAGRTDRAASKSRASPRSAVRRWLPFAATRSTAKTSSIGRGRDRAKGCSCAVTIWPPSTSRRESTRGQRPDDVTFHVNPGRQFRLTDVSFIGNQQVPDEASCTASSPRRRAADSAACCTHCSAVRPASRADRSATIATPSSRTIACTASGGDRRRRRSSRRAETARWACSSRSRKAPQTLLAERARRRHEQIAEKHPDAPQLQLDAGEPLNPQLLHDDVVALQTYYANRGHVEVQVAPRVTVCDGQDAARRVVVHRSPKVRTSNVDEVIVRGNTYTDRDVDAAQARISSRAIRSATRRMLEAQRELYRLGIFQRVEIQPDADRHGRRRSRRRDPGRGRDATSR